MDWRPAFNPALFIAAITNKKRPVRLVPSRPVKNYC
jgi:hypothetical protein